MLHHIILRPYGARHHQARCTTCGWRTPATWTRTLEGSTMTVCFYTDEGTRYCAECDRTATHVVYGYGRWGRQLCLFHAPGALADRLEVMPTLSHGHGHTGDLKHDDGHLRVWLERGDRDDGYIFDRPVHVEQQVDGAWIFVAELDGDGDHAPDGNRLLAELF